MPKRKKSILKLTKKAPKTKRLIKGAGPRKHSRQAEFSLKMREKISENWLAIRKNK